VGCDFGTRDLELGIHTEIFPAAGEFNLPSKIEAWPSGLETGGLWFKLFSVVSR